MFWLLPFVAIKLGMFPDPLACNPILTNEFDQSYDVLFIIGLLAKSIVFMEVPLHNVVSFKGKTFGTGFIVISICSSGPTQLLFSGV